MHLSGTSTSQSALRAQTTTGLITGVVADSTGAVLPGADVSVVNRDTGQERIAVSDASGLYVVPQLAPGAYTLTAKKEGFATIQTGQHSALGQSKFDHRPQVLGGFERSNHRSELGAADVEHNVIDTQRCHRA